MCRYSVKAHAYGAYTVRDKYSGDILTFDFGSYLEHKQAQADARRVADALESAYNAGIERGAREQRDYTTDVLVAAAREAQALNEPIDSPAIPRGKSGYPSGNTDKSREIQERWRENNS